MNRSDLIPTQTVEIPNANILDVEAGGTLGGGDASHGGRTYVRVGNLASTCWAVRITYADGTTVHVEQPGQVEVLLGGDSEQETFVAALRFAADAIEGRTASGTGIAGHRPLRSLVRVVTVES